MSSKKINMFGKSNLKLLPKMIKNPTIGETREKKIINILKNIIFNGSAEGKVSGSSSRKPFLKVLLCGSTALFHEDPCISFQQR